MEFEQSGHASGGSHAPGAEVKDLSGGSKVCLEGIGGTVTVPPDRGLGKKIEKLDGSGCRPDHRETAPSGRGEDGFRKAGNKPAPKGGVGHSTAGSKDICCRVRGAGMSRGHDGSFVHPDKLEAQQLPRQ
jgi:hypothetical protein